jgi:hypothetical protein
MKGTSIKVGRAEPSTPEQKAKASNWAGGVCSPVARKERDSHQSGAGGAFHSRDVALFVSRFNSVPARQAGLVHVALNCSVCCVVKTDLNVAKSR